MLHLLGYDVNIQDLKDFRQLDSRYRPHIIRNLLIAKDTWTS